MSQQQRILLYIDGPSVGSVLAIENQSTRMRRKPVAWFMRVSRVERGYIDLLVRMPVRAVRFLKRLQQRVYLLQWPNGSSIALFGYARVSRTKGVNGSCAEYNLQIIPVTLPVWSEL